MPFMRPSYKENTTLFLTAAQSAGGNLHFYPHPDTRSDRPLMTTVATFGPERANQVVIISTGARGQDLSLGTALQARWMASIPGLEPKKKPKKFIFVYALNPVGAAAKEMGFSQDRAPLWPQRVWDRLVTRHISPVAQEIFHVDLQQRQGAVEPAPIAFWPDKRGFARALIVSAQLDLIAGMRQQPVLLPQKRVDNGVVNLIRRATLPIASGLFSTVAGMRPEKPANLPASLTPLALTEG